MILVDGLLTVICRLFLLQCNCSVDLIFLLVYIVCTVQVYSLFLFCRAFVLVWIRNHLKVHFVCPDLPLGTMFSLES